MIRRCACVIAAMTYFSAWVALAEDAVGANGSNPTAAIAEPQPTNAENPSLRQPPPTGNPLWRIPIDSLSVTRERPLFSVSRRPPPPSPAPPVPPATNGVSSAPAKPERPRLTLQGTAIGKPRDIALVLDEVVKRSVSLQVGEAVQGWYLRSVDHEAVTLENGDRIMIIALPAPGASPLSDGDLADLAPDRSDQPNRRDRGGPHAKTGVNWISRAHPVY
jgi:hypothetical protein